MKYTISLVTIIAAASFSAHATIDPSECTKTALQAHFNPMNPNQADKDPARGQSDFNHSIDGAYKEFKATVGDCLTRTDLQIQVLDSEMRTHTGSIVGLLQADDEASAAIKQNRDDIAQTKDDVTRLDDSVSLANKIATENKKNTDMLTNSLGRTNRRLMSDETKISADEQQIAANTKSTSDNAQHITLEDQQIHTLANAQSQVSSTLSDHESRITNLEQSFDALAKDYNSFKKETHGAIAGVAAMASLAQPYKIHDFNLGVGVGEYAGEQGLAVGASYRATQHVVLKSALSYNTGDDAPIVAGSVNFNW